DEGSPEVIANAAHISELFKRVERGVLHLVWIAERLIDVVFGATALDSASRRIEDGAGRIFVPPVDQRRDDVEAARDLAIGIASLEERVVGAWLLQPAGHREDLHRGVCLRLLVAEVQR